MILRDAPRRRLRERLGTAVTGSWRFGPGFAGSAEAARIWARLHRVLIKLRGRSNVRFGPLWGLKSDISRGPRSAITGCEQSQQKTLGVRAVKQLDSRGSAWKLS